MPTCLNCKTKFPIRAVIDGKPRNLQRRKYCLKCSPFGEHNTRPFGYVSLSGVERPCECCGKPLLSSRKVCPSCQANCRRFELKRRAVAYLGGKCEECGYSKCLGALSFHHKDPSKKEFSIGSSHCRSWEAIKAELDKCRLLCLNCHSEFHWGASEKYRKHVEAKWLARRDSNPRPGDYESHALPTELRAKPGH